MIIVLRDITYIYDNDSSECLLLCNFDFRIDLHTKLSPVYNIGSVQSSIYIIFIYIYIFSSISSSQSMLSLAKLIVISFLQSMLSLSKKLIVISFSQSMLSLAKVIVISFLQSMLSLAKLHLINGDLDSCQRQLISVLKTDKDNDQATLVRIYFFRNMQVV